MESKVQFANDSIIAKTIYQFVIDPMQVSDLFHHVFDLNVEFFVSVLFSLNLQRYRCIGILIELQSLACNFVDFSLSEIVGNLVLLSQLQN